MDQEAIPRYDSPMSAEIIKVDKSYAGQRLDNFLISRLKGVPKTRIYRAIRKGEVRVNKGRCKADYRVQADDQVRIPPIRQAEQLRIQKPNQQLAEFLEQQILFEDKQCIVINKPSGLPVHGGSNISAGLIEMLRVMRPYCKFLELVHRIDRETSGCLLIAKKRAFLVELHQMLRDRQVDKSYLALVGGKWQGNKQVIEAPLLKNTLKSGERMVVVSKEGRAAKTVVYPLKKFADATLVIAKPITGRTHQLRVHLAHIGHPIAGDQKYGQHSFNNKMRAKGLAPIVFAFGEFVISLPRSTFRDLCSTRAKVAWLVEWRQGKLI